MDNQELQTLLADLESDRVERKECLAEPERVHQSICAFANDLPAPLELEIEQGHVLARVRRGP